MKQIITILFFLFCLLIFVPSAYGWYGAGYSKNWPNTQNGAKGKVISPLYKIPPESYVAGDTIGIQFRIENPINNIDTISQDLYLHLWKVEKIDANTKILSEDKLYQNHSNKKDLQSLYDTVSLGQLVLLPGDTSEFEAAFTILEPGYYQFDVTDLKGSDKFLPGHIYAAGFLRVENAPQHQGVLGTKDTHNTLWEKAILAALFSLVFTTLVFFLWKKRRQKNEESKIQPRQYFYN